MKLQKGFLFLGGLILAAGCATTPDVPPSLSNAAKPAWSVKATPSDMIVAVSPAGKTLKVAGTTGLVLGSGADAVVNAVYRDRIHDALKDYKPAEAFEKILSERLDAAVTSELKSVAPLGSTAGFQSRQDVIDVRYEDLAKDDYDLVLDLVTQYGIYGPSGILAVRLDGKLVQLPGIDTVWSDTLVVTNDLVLADTDLGDPTSRQGINVTSPQFTVDDEAVNRWTAEGGKILRERFESAVQDSASTLLYALGLEQSATGAYHMGKLAMNRKKFEEASVHFKKAISLASDSADATNAYAVALSHNKQVDDAIRMCSELVSAQSEYGPAHYNLAWWYATEKKNASNAKIHYDKARSLGMPENEKIEKAINKGS
ncbi:MAG: hypothetical protein AMXMBFR84_36610 [Candidatus Hydrogenedentota bacterium]